MHLTREFGALLVQTHTKLHADRNLVILANQWRGEMARSLCDFSKATTQR